MLDRREPLLVQPGRRGFDNPTRDVGQGGPPPHPQRQSQPAGRLLYRVLCGRRPGARHLTIERQGVEVLGGDVDAVAGPVRHDGTGR